MVTLLMVMFFILVSTIPRVRRDEFLSTILIEIVYIIRPNLVQPYLPKDELHYSFFPLLGNAKTLFPHHCYTSPA